MRRIVLAGLCFLIGGPGALFAQNKTLGVGVATPNPNAALHVESPTGNQGFLMPRLTSVQIEAMSALLGDADKGLMVYDSDRYSVFIWDGTSWGSTSQFVIDNPASVDDAISAYTSGSGNAGRFVINNTATFSHALYAETNGDSTSAAVHGNSIGEGMGVFGRSSGSKFASAAVYGEHVGTGDAAGAFRISNPANTYSALYGETNGSGPAIYGNQNGMGRGGQFQITNASNTQAAIRGYTAGLGNVGFFTVNNAANDSAALYTTTNGTGAAITAHSTGTGVALMARTATGFSAIQGEATGGVSNGVSGISRAADPGSYAILGTNTGGGPAGVFNITSVTNSSRVISATTAGQGPAGYFEQTNVEAWSPALMVRADGQGAAFNATSSSVSANANAAEFVVENPANPRNAIMATTVGMGSAVSVSINNTASTGSAIFTETNGSGTAIDAQNTGTADGFAGTFRNTDAGNTFPAIQAGTAGTGPGVRVIQSATSIGLGMDVIMQNPASAMPGLSVGHDGVGRAGEFVVNNNTSTAPSLVAETNGTGPALQASSINSNGMAIEMVNGGLKYSVTDITAPGQITAVAAVYKISVAGQGIVVALPTNVPEGTFCKVFNNSGSDVTVDPVYVLGAPSTVTITVGRLMDFIFLNGSWYENP